MVVCTAAGLSVDRFDAAHPALTQLMYALDADNGTAQWLSDEPSVQKWTVAVRLRPAAHGQRRRCRRSGPKQVRTGPAQAAALPAPETRPSSRTRQSGGTRTLTLRLTPQRPVRLVTPARRAPAPGAAATVGGRPVPVTAQPPDGRWGFGFVFHGPPAGGVEVTLTVRASGPVKFRAMDGSDGLGELPGFHARPAGVGVVGSHTSELLAVAKTYTCDRPSVMGGPEPAPRPRRPVGSSKRKWMKSRPQLSPSFSTRW